MTVYRFHVYAALGAFADTETDWDDIPETVTEIWDREGHAWNRDGDGWVPVGGDGVWSTEEVLEEYGPVTDERDAAYRDQCPFCLVEMVDEEHVKGHLP